MGWFMLSELRDMVVLALAIGFVFEGMFRHPRLSPLGIQVVEPAWKPYALAAAAIVPGIILHELFHKFTAMAFGASAYFHTGYAFLVVAVVLKLIGSPFIFLAPAYVSIVGQVTQLQGALIALAGPVGNLVMFLAATLVRRLPARGWFATPDGRTVVNATARINLLLFGFNLLPIPGFDGFKVWSALFQYLGGLV